MPKNLSKKEEKEAFMKLLMDVSKSLELRDLDKLKLKTKELSDELDDFQSRKLSSVIYDIKNNDYPLSVLLNFYKPRIVALTHLTRFFTFVKTLDGNLNEATFIYYKLFFDRSLIPFYTAYPKQ